MVTEKLQRVVQNKTQQLPDYRGPRYYLLLVANDLLLGTRAAEVFMRPENMSVPIGKKEMFQ